MAFVVVGRQALLSDVAHIVKDSSVWDVCMALLYGTGEYIEDDDEVLGVTMKDIAESGTEKTADLPRRLVLARITQKMWREMYRCASMGERMAVFTEEMIEEID